MKTIVVNSVTHVVQDEQSYAGIVKCAGLDPNYLWTITYSGRRVGDVRRAGTLTPGKTLQVEDHMMFTVVDTGNA